MQHEKTIRSVITTPQSNLPHSMRCYHAQAPQSPCLVPVFTSEVHAESENTGSLLTAFAFILIEFYSGSRLFEQISSLTQRERGEGGAQRR
jgi:hypothetical protein